MPGECLALIGTDMTYTEEEKDNLVLLQRGGMDMANAIGEQTSNHVCDTVHRILLPLACVCITRPYHIPMNQVALAVHVSASKFESER